MSKPEPQILISVRLLEQLIKLDPGMIVNDEVVLVESTVEAIKLLEAYNTLKKVPLNPTPVKTWTEEEKKAFIESIQKVADEQSKPFERVPGCCCPPPGYTGIWMAVTCPVHFGFNTSLSESNHR